VIDHERRLRELLPGAEVHLSGSACMPGLDPGDIDLVVLVEDVAGAAVILRSRYRCSTPMSGGTTGQPFVSQVLRRSTSS
jgi:hypothetical protein